MTVDESTLDVAPNRGVGLHVRFIVVKKSLVLGLKGSLLLCFSLWFTILTILVPCL
ncbi:hypothetical protein HanIR_Chr04g0161801 [Helianthus annuus]|nr:hypothetical protein HanIR_Chr04g0161801 [Helianthus annuus]